MGNDKAITDKIIFNKALEICVMALLPVIETGSTGFSSVFFSGGKIFKLDLTQLTQEQFTEEIMKIKKDKP